MHDFTVNICVEKMKYSTPKQSGFTLLELIVTLGMVAILAAIGIPAMSDWTQRAQVRSETQRYLGILNLARSTAIQTNQVVTIAATANADDSVDINIYGGPNSPGNQAFSAATDTLIRTMPGEATGLVIDTDPNTPYISFDQNGRLLAVGLGNTMQLDVMNENENLGRTIVINAVGRATISEMSFD